MTPKEEFERWWDKDNNALRLIANFPRVKDNTREAFLVGYEQGYAKGNNDGFREGSQIE